jgi:MtfA peptidase
MRHSQIGTIMLESSNDIVSSIIQLGFILALTVYALNVFMSAWFMQRLLPSPLLLKKLEKRYKLYLLKYFPFYNALSEKQKKTFEKRVQKFIDLKQFIPRGGIKVVTPEMKAMIAGSAIQLSFGYPNVYFRHFRKILIYPDNYYSTITRQYHKGEVNVRGLIVLSWKDFHSGFTNSTDGVNLGLHEMAHALRLINIVENNEFNFYEKRIMMEFDKEARLEMDKIRNSIHGPSIFRAYSITNHEEFFAVAVELFFERACIFKEYYPRLYELLVDIFKIDPESICKKSQYSKIA